jgi:hypothetical protein
VVGGGVSGGGANASAPPPLGSAAVGCTECALSHGTCAGLPVLKLHEFNPLVKFGQDATPETDAGKDAKQPQPLLSPKSAYSCLPLPTLLAGYALRSQLPAVECGPDAWLRTCPCHPSMPSGALRSALPGARAADECHGCPFPQTPRPTALVPCACAVPMPRGLRWHRWTLAKEKWCTWQRQRLPTRPSPTWKCMLPR